METILIIIVILLLLGWGGGVALHVGGDLINILLFLALAAFVYWLWTGRKPLQ